MILDWHSHIYTPEEAADDLRTWDGNTGPSWGERGCPMVLENFVRAHKENNIDISVVTNAAHYLKGKRADEELPSVQAWTDYAAKVQQDHKGMLYSFATILPCGGPAFIKETERAIKQLGLKGIFIHSSHKGHYPDDDEARPFWELVQDLDVPVMIHPPHLGFGEERMKEYRLASSIGRPFDLCLALGRHDRARRARGFPEAEDRRLARRRRHLRDHQPDGLRLRIAGRGVLPRLLRADEDQAHAEPLSEDAVYRHRLLQHAGGEDGAGVDGPGPRALRQRRAAAHLAQAARHQADPGSGYSRRRQGKDLLEQRAPVCSS